MLEPTWRRDGMVFVDPDDDGVQWWWPALLVPENEIEVFRQTLLNNSAEFLPPLKDDDVLVVYFEDGSL